MATTKIQTGAFPADVVTTAAIDDLSVTHAKLHTAMDLSSKTVTLPTLSTLNITGNVGIGETVPLGKLHVKTASSGASADASADELVVEGNGNAGISILSGQSNVGSIYFGDASVNWDGYIAYSQASRTMTLGTAAGAGSVTINSTGNVGIGTSSAFTRAVVGDGSGTEVLTIYSGSSGEGQLRFADGTSGSASYQGRVEYDHVNGRLNLGAGGTTPFTLDSSGHLGIGTVPSNPDGFDRILQVHGTNSAVMRFTGSTYGVGANDGVYMGFSYGGLEIVNPRTTGYTRFQMTGGEAMRIDSAGRVGIATGGAVNTNAHANADDLVIGNTSNRTGMTIVSDPAQNGNIHFSDGTSTGNANIKGQFTYEHSDNSFRFYVNSSTEVLRLTSSGGTVFNNGQDINQNFTVKANGDANALFIDGNGGNVGIGESNPTSVLSISKNSSRTTDFENMLKITHTSSGTTGVGFGSAIYFVGERENGVNQAMGRLLFDAEVNSGTNISSGFSVQTATAGTTSEKFRITHDGKVLLTGGGVIGSNGTADTIVLSGSNAEHVGAGITLHGNAHSNASQTWFKAGSTTVMKIAGGRIGMGRDPSSSIGSYLQIQSNDGISLNRSGQTNPFIMRNLSSTDGDGVRFTIYNTGDILKVKSDGVRVIGHGNSTTADNISVDYLGTSGGHMSGYLFRDKRDVVNAAIKNDLQDDGIGTAAAHLRFQTSHGGTLTTQMTIDRYGQVMMPNQPSFRAHSTNDYTADGILESANWTEQHDNNGDFSNGRFTAPVDGVYLFEVMWDSKASLGGLNLLKNANYYIVKWEPTGISTASWESRHYSTTVKLSSGDYVRLVGVHASGTNPFHMGGGHWGFFSGHLLG